MIEPVLEPPPERFKVPVRTSREPELLKATLEKEVAPVPAVVGSASTLLQ